MKSITLTALFCVCNLIALAQQPKESKEIEKDINTTLWIPFKTSFENRDWEAFNNLHTDDVLRITKRGIRIGDEYKDSNKKSFQREGGPKRTIDFSFESRVYNQDVGHEVGYYRIKYLDKDGQEKETYAMFQVLLRKVKGTWKITQDWDSDRINVREITKEDFESGKLLSGKD